MKLMGMTVKDFVEELASSSPAPGGGTIAAVTAAFGAGLGSMVCQLSIGNPKYPEAEEQLTDVLGQLENHYQRLVVLADEDTEAFNKVMAAFKLPKETEEEKAIRKEAIAKANLGATLVPLETAELAVEVLEALPAVVTYGNKNAISDCGVAIECSNSGALGALMNVAINVGSIKDPQALAEVQAKQEELKDRLETGYGKASSVLAQEFQYR